MNKITISSWHIIWNMVLADLIEFREVFWSKLINLVIWIACTVLVLGVILSKELALKAGFGVFMFAGCFGSVGLCEVYPRVFCFLNDLESEQTIFYHLTLPLSSWLVIVKTIISQALQSSALGLFLLPIGKLLLWKELQLGCIAIHDLLGIFIVSNIFYAVFAVWAVALIPGFSKIGNLWSRYILPLWFFGGFQFSWSTLHTISASLGYIALCNPITYIMEGTRAALLNSQNYLAVWHCVVVLCFLSSLCAWHAIVLLKKRLDFV